MNTLDLFSGIGGFSLGVERTGWKTVAFCEVLPICRHLLAHHWPEVPCYDDVQTLTAAKLRSDGIVRIDAIVGGFPCQDLSYAGKGAGLAGARSGLWSEFARLVRELRPRVVIVENVPALLNRGLGVVLADLAACGYDAEWDCIPASAVGAPHRRDRIWIIAYARGEQHEGFGDAFRRALTSELFGDDTDAKSERQPKRRGLRCDEPTQRIAGFCETVADADWARLEKLLNGQEGKFSTALRTYDWSIEPAFCRVASRVPARVDRLHGLGNAVVPEIPYRLAKAINQAFETIGGN